MLNGHDAQPVDSPVRDGVGTLDGSPTIVSISDIHGFLREARSALLTLGDHPDYEPIVEAGRLRRLQWVGGEEYVLVFNGDLIDRGAHSEQVIEMVERLIEQAPPGHVRVTFGNHEMGVLTPDFFDWGDWYSTTRTDSERLDFIRAVQDGHITAAYEGYNVVYAHAGQPNPYDVTAMNEELLRGVEQLRPQIGTEEDAGSQEELVLDYPGVFGVDGATGRGKGAGIAWMDFEHMPADAPPQVVGHTRHDSPTRKGNVICENVIRNNRRGDGGEAVLLETPETIVALGRDEDGEVKEHTFSTSPLRE